MVADSSLIIYEKKIVQRYFNNWKITVKILKSYALAEIKAVTYYNFCLKRKVLKSLKTYCDIKKRKHRLYEEAARHWKLTVLRSTWMKWKISTEQYASMTIEPQIKRALCFWRNKMVHKYFLLLKRNVDCMKRKRVLKTRVYNFHKLSIYKFCFTSWINHYKEEQFGISLERQAVAFHQVICIRNCIAVWKTKYTYLYKNQRQNEEALYYYETTIVKRCFKSWFQWTKYKITIREKTLQAKAYYSYHLLTLSMSCWKQFVSESLKERENEIESSRFYHGKIISRTFNKWVCYHQWHRDKTMRAMSLLQKRQHQQMLNVLDSWRKYVIRRNTMRNMLNVAEQHRNHRLLINSFVSWKTYMKYRQEKYVRMDTMKEKMKSSQLYKGLMMFYFKNWYKQYVEVKKIFIESEEKLKRKYFLKWHIMYLEAAERKSEKQKVEFQVKIMKMKWWFSIWNFTYQKKLQSNKKRIQALIHWSTTLERKCMKKWQLYTASKKALLMTDKGSSTEKLSETLDQQIKEMTIHECRIALKYFRKWKLKVWSRKSNLKTLVYADYEYSVTEESNSVKISQSKSYQDLDNLCNYLLRKNRMRTVPRIPKFLKEVPVQQNFGNTEHSCQCIYRNENERWLKNTLTIPRHSKNSDYFYVPYKGHYHSQVLETLPESYSEDSLKSNDSGKTYRVNTPTYMSSTLFSRSHKQDSYENLQL